MNANDLRTSTAQSISTVRWKEQLQLQMRRDLISSLEALYSCVEEDSDTNQMVDNFSEKIRHVLGKYCTSERRGKKASTNLTTNEGKPWFNQRVKNLYSLYLTALENCLYMFI